MHNREKSVFSVIDATQGQYDCPLPLWELATVELWEKNENENNKYKKIEVYNFVNFFPIEEFKSKFFNEFEIYKTSYPEGTIETFRKKEYQQFIYDCGDMIEMIDKQDYYYWITVRGFDFYLQQRKGWQDAYVLNKDLHTHEINLKALLQFLEIDCINDKVKEFEDKKNLCNEEVDAHLHALHYMLELTANNKSKPIDKWGKFKRKIIEEEGKLRVGDSGQYFYLKFKTIDLSKPCLIKISFGENWQDKVVALCENDKITIEYILENYPRI
jgi:hypothetical protein